ncbi:MAG TPA: Na+/H+ antiporter NhaC family protein [Victivallales bacterium]|nr:Na+/H+ antiporter NhaC family protein [Victivallales bacterium]
MIGDFYKVPITVAALLAAVIAILMNKNESLDKKVDLFTIGAGNQTIILMCVIFILAGVFSSIAKDTGAVDSTVNLALTILPEKIILPGIFVIACFISLAIGTSTGTIAALGPIAVGIAQATGYPVALVLGAVLSGAMFGDSLSFISDTTIAATRTQGCNMKDKFKMNFKIVLPAAIITFIIFLIISDLASTVHMHGTHPYQLYKVIPYVVVIVISIIGVNVFLVLIIGIILSIIVGFISGAFDIWRLFDVTQAGIGSMTNLILISTMLAGTVELIKHNGGIDKILSIMKNRIHGIRGAEFGIGILVSLVNFCTANNTVAIIVTGPLAKDVADKYNVSPKRSASLLDIFSCAIQGVIPYGAQILLAVSFVGMDKLSPITVMKYAYYPYLTGICVILAIIFKIPKSKRSYNPKELNDL